MSTRWEQFLNFVNVFYLFYNYLSLEKVRALHSKKLESPSPKDAFPKFGWNWLSGYGEEDFLISSMYFNYFIVIFPWRRGGSFIWTNLNLLHSRMLCAKFGWNWLSGSGEEDFFLISSMYFHYFVIISPCKRAGPFIWTNLNPLHPRMLCAKFGWNWLSGSGEEDFF